MHPVRHDEYEGVDTWVDPYNRRVNRPNGVDARVDPCSVGRVDLGCAPGGNEAGPLAS